MNEDELKAKLKEIEAKLAGYAMNEAGGANRRAIEAQRQVKALEETVKQHLSGGHSPS